MQTTLDERTIMTRLSLIEERLETCSKLSQGNSIQTEENSLQINQTKATIEQQTVDLGNANGQIDSLKEAFEVNEVYILSGPRMKHGRVSIDPVFPNLGVW